MEYKTTVKNSFPFHEWGKKDLYITLRRIYDRRTSEHKITK
uniref:Uncharacterized protein n=1 Tax=Setaria italica TaxID=4555 RepID=K3XTK9_SETIT